ncbi:ABC transporter permease [Clostridia bacterium]|nr:ABC transporter permease [Clostridia bacterium]
MKKKKIGDWIIIIFFFLLMLVCLLPIWNIAVVSLSSTQAIINREVSFIPIGLNLDAYRYIWADKSFVQSLGFTAVLTVFCTVLSLVMTILCAYPLAQRHLEGKKGINIFIVLTMYFSAGAIPNYLLMQSLNLLDTVWVLIVPNCLSVFNMIILKSFFSGIPESLKESAKLDGAGDFTILRHIYLPLSKSILATLALFYAVGRWNGFTDIAMYITKPSYYTIQYKLYQILNSLTSVDSHVEGMATTAVTGESMKAATVMFATIPILIVYPWIQKYFTAGVTVGAVKE